MNYPTRLHDRLAEGSVAVGMCSVTNSPTMLELLVSGSDVDFVGVDIQHGAITSPDASNLLRAVQAIEPDVTPLVRLPDHGKYWIEQSLDAGYMGLIVPLTESADQAAQLVRRAYYPPVGARSKATAVRASLYPDYFETINDRLILLPQIESSAGLDHVEEIVAVEGVSGVLLGPCDLSLDKGWPQDTLWDHEPFLAAAQRVSTACRDTDKIPAILAGGDGPLKARDMGYRIIGVAGDGYAAKTLLPQHVNAEAKALRS